MIKILEKSDENMSKVDLYRLTQSPELQMLKKVDDGTQIVVTKWCEFEDTKVVDGKEEATTLLSIMDENGVAYTAQSATFRASFFDIVDIMDGEQFTIKKISGLTKAERPYINCVLVG